jgi:hypothetical protein
MSFSITPSVFNCLGEESGAQYSLPFTDRLANGDSAANSSTWCDLPSENSAMECKPGGARAPLEADAISKEILFRLQCVPPWMAWACDKPTSFETRRARKGLERLTRSPSASLLVGACRQRGAGSNPAPATSGSVAQGPVHLIVDQEDVGSNPIGSASSCRVRLNGTDARPLNLAIRVQVHCAPPGYCGQDYRSDHHSFKLREAVRIRCAVPTYFSFAFISESELC